jgi:ribosomal peptide maturation radical SAM protein 1
MPWQDLRMPSIQLGILQSVLERARIRSQVRTLSLAFMEHCRTETAGLPEADRIDVADYQMIAHEYDVDGVGDWIFAIPPFRDALGPEAARELLGGWGVPEARIAKALAMRRVVPGFLERAVDEVLATGARIVGFTSTFSQSVPSLVMAQILKRRDPSLTILFGGANCDGPMGAALHRVFAWVDVVVRGEAERVLPEVVQDVLAGRPMRPHPGLCYRDGGRSVVVSQSASAAIPMDEVPPPIFDDYFERLAKTSFAVEIGSRARLVYESARGCWWGAKSHCTFCGLNGTAMAFRSKSPARVVQELTALAQRYGRLDFEVTDNILDMSYFREVLPRLRDARLDLRLFYETKANLTREQVRLLREAGVHYIQPGIESLSTPILLLMRKGVTALQNIRLLKWCAEFGIRPSWNLMYGLPGEAPQEYARMTDLIPSLTHLQPPKGLGRFSLHRFSPYHERASEFGLEILGPRAWYRHVYDADEATLMDLAYTFEYRHLDGRDPDAYAAPLRRAVEGWYASAPTSYRALRYRRGPGLLVVEDRRSGLECGDYSLADPAAEIYLACEAGATVQQVCEALAAGGTSHLDSDQVRDILDELVARRLMYEENRRYLALALPATLLEAV